MSILLGNTPHLLTALKGPLSDLEKIFLTNQARIETWFRQQWLKISSPIYSSVDIRNAGFKAAPVDTNLFSAGFNNLNPDFLPLAIQAAQATISKLFPDCQSILLIPENHTRNQFYFENLAVLTEILQKAGYDIRIGSISDEITKETKLTLPSGKTIVLYPVIRKQDRLYVENFSPCIVILNNDLSAGVPNILQNLQMPVIPHTGLGWATRSKYNHFQYYKQVSDEFAAEFKFDPWLIQAFSDFCNEVDFVQRTGETCLIAKVEKMLARIQEKYKEYGIQEKPFVVIKADAGTYGMGILIVDDPAQISALNRKQRTTMAKTKGSQKIDKVMLQEGVYTFERIGETNAVAEPVVYMLGQYVIGGFYRVHNERSETENLNAPGMHFEPLAFATPCNNPDYSESLCAANRFYAYGVIGRLAALAAGYEAQELKGKTA